MIAIGGKSGQGPAIPGYDPTFSPHDGYAVAHAVNTALMLQALAAQVDANTREIAELKRAAADRKGQAADVAQALFGLFPSRLPQQIGQAGRAIERTPRASPTAEHMRSRLCSRDLVRARSADPSGARTKSLTSNRSCSMSRNTRASIAGRSGSIASTRATNARACPRVESRSRARGQTPRDRPRAARL